MKNDPRHIELELRFFIVFTALLFSTVFLWSDKSLSFSLKATLTLIRGYRKEKDRKGKQRKCINTMEIKVYFVF